MDSLCKRIGLSAGFGATYALGNGLGENFAARGFWNSLHHLWLDFVVAGIAFFISYSLLELIRSKLRKTK